MNSQLGCSRLEGLQLGHFQIEVIPKGKVIAVEAGKSLVPSG